MALDKRLCSTAFAGAVGAALAFGPGCAWKVVPPREVETPAAVYLTEYGRHTRVALPANGATLVEYGFGEWNFYGLERQGAWSGLRAISGMGTGAFSRREISSGAPETVARALGGRRTERILVERSAANRLRAALDARWQANQPEVVVREWDGVAVSRDPQHYHLYRNSNHASARWLEELGCEIRGVPVFSNFTIVGNAEGGDL